MTWTADEAARLAQWAMAWLVNRKDAFGGYRAGKPYADKSGLDLAKLERHFRGEIVIGLYAIDPMTNAAEYPACRWACFDWDNHEDEQPVRAANLKAAIAVGKRLISVGIEPIIEDSDGRGGIHLWAVLRSPVESRRLFLWAMSLLAGIEPKPELFPKQATIAHGGYGSWVRLPGKHHKRDHWSRFWIADQWMDGSDAAEWLVDQVGGPSDLIPAVDLPASYAAPAPNGEVPDGVVAGEGLEDLAKDEAEAFSMCVAALWKLPPTYRDEYDKWYLVGAAVHYVSRSPDMLAIFTRWSAKSPKYKPGDCIEKWKEYEKRPPGAPVVGLGSLIHWAGGDGSLAALDVLEAAQRPSDVAASGSALLNPGEKQKALGAISLALGVKVEKLIQRGEDPGFIVYVAVIDGRAVTIGNGAKLLNYSTFRTTVFEATGHLCKLNPKKWDRVVRQFGMIRETEPIEEDTPAGLIKAALTAWITNQHPNIAGKRDNLDDIIEARFPFVADGLFYLNVPLFLTWCRASRIDMPNPYKLLRLCGWSARVVGGNIRMRYWSAPLDSDSVPDVARTGNRAKQGGNERD